MCNLAFNKLNIPCMCVPGTFCEEKYNLNNCKFFQRSLKESRLLHFVRDKKYNLLKIVIFVKFFHKMKAMSHIELHEASSSSRAK